MNGSSPEEKMLLQHAHAIKAGLLPGLVYLMECNKYNHKIFLSLQNRQDANLIESIRYNNENGFSYREYDTKKFENMKPPYRCSVNIPVCGNEHYGAEATIQMLALMWDEQKGVKTHPLPNCDVPLISIEKIANDESTLESAIADLTNIANRIYEQIRTKRIYPEYEEWKANLII